MTSRGIPHHRIWMRNVSFVLWTSFSLSRSLNLSLGGGRETLMASPQLRCFLFSKLVKKGKESKESGLGIVDTAIRAFFRDRCVSILDPPTTKIGFFFEKPSFLKAETFFAKNVFACSGNEKFYLAHSTSSSPIFYLHLFEREF